MPTIYGAVDLVKNEIRNVAAQNLGTAPSSPVKGQFYFNSTDNVLYWWDGTVWVAAKATASVPMSNTITTIVVGGAGAGGSASDAARGDHVHALAGWGSSTAETTFGTAKGDGAATTFARSDHTHGNPVHDAAAHSTIPIDSLAVPAVGLNMNAKKITNMADPSAASDATTKQYVDNLSAGLSWKDAARVATTGNITQTNTQTIDGVAVIVGDRVLCKNQSTASQNGIWIVAAGAWTRATDADSSTELESAAVFISEGSTLADTAWVMTTNLPITVGSTSLTWVQFGAPAAYIGGAGLTLTGNTFDVGAGTGITVATDSVAVDTLVIATVANLSTKADKTTTLTAGAGLTGGGDLSVNRTLDVGAGTGITVAVDTVAVDTSVIATRSYVDTAVVGVTKKYAAALAGTSSPETVTHNLNTRDVTVSVINSASPWQAVEVDWEATTVNTLTVRFSPNLGAGYRIVVIG
jgi:hypothetical protein